MGASDRERERDAFEALIVAVDVALDVARRPETEMSSVLAEALLEVSMKRFELAKART